MNNLSADTSTLLPSLHNVLQKKEQQGLTRKLQPVRTGEHGRIRVNGADYLNLAGNDYLGLAGNRDLVQEFYADLGFDNCLQLFGPGSTASRLMTGNHDGYRMLEENLTALYGTDSVLIFNSGYHINIGLLPALAGKGDLILADKLCHASLIDGMRLSRARVIRYPHLDCNRIEELLKTNRDQYNTIFLVTESIFSMDGDCADLRTMVRLKEQYGAVLYVDEAHAVGVRGKNGLGISEEQGVTDRVDLLVGTFGKAWAGQGAFVACVQTVYDYLINTARSLIFTTALPPVNIHWLNFILPKIRQMRAERQELFDLGSFLRNALQDQGLETAGDSQIVPVMIGDAERSVSVAQQLRKHGFWLSAVRPPTVPAGTSRLRLSITAAMNRQQLAPLARHIARALHQA
jgi:8-amino-7-oxononanoate synthase